jgi:lipopolysaccharide/colanic/teichoic acid biosynthesis glycosyltransferase
VYRVFFKRVLDILLSGVLFCLLLPLMGVVLLFLLVANNGRVFYTQLRPGKNDKIFRLYKFRTIDVINGVEHMLPAGNFLRRTSLDELPQLINVLKGEMSLVGPRPLLVEYLDLYSDYQRKRHEVRPGITGWAQVNGRNSLSWEEKFSLDVYYVENLSFLFDIQIVIKTFFSVLKRKDINAAGDIPVEKFRGN